MTVFQGAQRLTQDPGVAPGGASAKVAAPEGKALADMTVKELVEICANERIDTPSKPKKADLVAAIEAARGR